MATYVLVHGSWHGAWCWYKIAPRLRAAGHRVIVPDMPAHGRVRRACGPVTLKDYVDCASAALDEAGEPAILVAHSRGGIVASQTAERRADRIARLVYLAAFLLPNGARVLEYGQGDRDSLIGPNLDVNRDEGWDMLRESAFRAALYADCDEDDVALAQALLTPEPIRPTLTPLELSEASFGRVPRSYIELLQDRAVSPALQRRMQAAMPCERVLALDASHSAYFSQPDALAAQLLAQA